MWYRNYLIFEKVSGTNPNRPSSPTSDGSSPRPKLDKGKERAKDESGDEEGDAADLGLSDFGGLSLSSQEIREQIQACEFFEDQKAAETQCQDARNAYETRQKHREEDGEEELRLQDEDEDLNKALQESMMDEYNRHRQPSSSDTGKSRPSSTSSTHFPGNFKY